MVAPTTKVYSTRGVRLCQSLTAPVSQPPASHVSCKSSIASCIAWVIVRRLVLSSALAGLVGHPPDRGKGCKLGCVAISVPLMIRAFHIHLPKVMVLPQQVPGRQHPREHRVIHVVVAMHAIAANRLQIL